jgi:hypothetical protein
MANTRSGPAFGGATHRRPTPPKERRIMQDTSPAASQRPEPITGQDVEGQARVEVTWFEDGVDQPADTPLIALLPVPDSS